MTELRTDGPYSPDDTKRTASLAAGAVRRLNHATLARNAAKALEWPADADQVIQDLAIMTRGEPQLLAQIREWFGRQAAAGRLQVAYGQYQGNTSGAVVAIEQDLLEAANHLGRAYEALDRARQVTAAIAGVDDGE